MVFESNALPNNDFVFSEGAKTFILTQEQIRRFLRLTTPLIRLAALKQRCQYLAVR